MSRLKHLTFLIGVFLMLASGSAKSEELKWTHYGLRPLGMGNAFIAVADDYNALFYNPAGLARIKEWDGEFLNPRLTFSQSIVEIASDIQELANASSDNEQAALETFQDLTGQTHHFSIGLTPHLIFRGFGFGAAFEVANTLVVHSDIDIEADLGVNLIAPFMFAGNVLDDRLSIGGGFKIVGKGGVDENFNIDDLSAFSENKNEEESNQTASNDKQLEDYVQGGFGLGFDFGLLFTPVKTMEPTIGLSVMDIGGTPYQKADVSGTALKAPATRLPAVNTGISVKPLMMNNMYLMLAADAHAINQPVHYSHKLNFGLEWGYGSIIKLQTGLKEGYLSGGFQFDVRYINLKAVTYVVDHGPVVGLHEDLAERRFALQLKILI